MIRIQDQKFNHLKIYLPTSSEFLSFVIWYDLLIEVNFVSKLFQSFDIDIGTKNSHLKGLLTFFYQHDYQESGFKYSVLNAKELAAELKIEPTLKKERTGQKQNRFLTKELMKQFHWEKIIFALNTFYYN